MKTLKKEWKCTALSTLFLLHANLFPDECDISVLKDSLTWNNGWLGDKTPPSWLLNATACTDLTAFSSLLLVSAVMLKGDHIHMGCEDSYVGSAFKFLRAVHLYKNGEFEGSINCLQSISSQKCGTDMQGWILWLTGVVLIRLEKPHTALLKLQAAVDKCEMCIPAVFNISQIFFRMDLGGAELETLSLLTVVSIFLRMQQDCFLLKLPLYVILKLDFQTISSATRTLKNAGLTGWVCLWCMLFSNHD